MSTEPTPAPQSAITTATVGGAYTPHEVAADAAQFGSWVKPGTWVIDTISWGCYRLSPDTAPYTFDLTPATDVYPEDVAQETLDTATTDGTSSVCQLAGAILTGEWIVVPPGRTTTVNDATIANMGEYLVVSTPQQTAAASLSEILDRPHPPNERFTDGSPGSVLTPPTEQDLVENRDDATRLIFTVNGSKAGIAHLLPTGAARPPETDAQTASTTADGGTTPGEMPAGVQPSIDAVPYFPAEDSDVTARFVPTSRHPAETFQEPNLRAYVETYMQGRVLNACAGPTSLNEKHDHEVVRNDINPDVESDLTVDIAELACHFPPNSFDTVIFDPPWSAYNSRLRYDGFVCHKSAADGLPVNQISVDVRDLPFDVPGEDAIEGRGHHQATLGSHSDKQAIIGSGNSDSRNSQSTETVDTTTPKDQLGHAKLAKLGFDYLLRDAGRIIQFAYTGSIMPADLGYQRVDRTAFDPTGTYKTLIAGVDINR